MIIEATRRHALRVAHHMEPALLARAEALGVDTRRELIRFIGMSAFARCWLYRGRYLAVGGILGTLASSEGHLWLAIDREAREHPRAFIKAARVGIAEILVGYRRIYSFVQAEIERDVRFAEFMGFRLGEVEHMNGCAMRRAVLEAPGG